MNLPEDFRTYTQALMGEELYQQLEHGLQASEVPASIRINPFKCQHGEQVKGEPIPWCPETGRYLSTRPNFTFDPLLHGGIYYVQEASSMFVDLVVRQLIHTPVTMLDLCAAPGGKSTCLRAALPDGCLLFSNEPMRTRSQILAENIQKFGFMCDAVTMWCFAVPLGCIVAFVLKLPVLMVYFVLNLDELVKLPAVFKHYRQYKWVKNLTETEN